MQYPAVLPSHPSNNVHSEGTLTVQFTLVKLMHGTNGVVVLHRDKSLYFWSSRYTTWLVFTWCYFLYPVRSAEFKVYILHHYDITNFNKRNRHLHPTFFVVLESALGGCWPFTVGGSALGGCLPLLVPKKAGNSCQALARSADKAAYVGLRPQLRIVGPIQPNILWPSFAGQSQEGTIKLSPC